MQRLRPRSAVCWREEVRQTPKGAGKNSEICVSRVSQSRPDGERIPGSGARCGGAALSRADGRGNACRPRRSDRDRGGGLLEIDATFRVLLAAVSAPETDGDWRAAEGADGKFLGPNRIAVAAHRWESRAGDTAEVRATGLPEDWEAEDVAAYFCERTGMARERVFRSGPRVVLDTRAGRVCSNGSMATFTCADPETAERVVEAFRGGREQFESVREPVRVCKRYPRWAEVRVKLVAQDRPVGKFSQSGRNVQVFGLKVNATNGQVRKFFSHYGEIESMRSVKTSRYVHNDTFHYNILFRTTNAASDAIKNAAGDEKKINPRLSRDGLVVQLYQEKIRAKPTGEGKQQGHGK